jgi:hypothetical protein
LPHHIYTEMKQEKEVKNLNFDIIGQKAYVNHGPHRNQMGIVKRKGIAGYELTIGDHIAVNVELKDLILVDVDLRDFYDWCEKNGM